MKNLQNFGVIEISTKEAESIQGGIICKLTIFVWEELGHFWTGIKNGIHDVTKAMK